MSKYPRQDDGFFGLDSTAFLWTILGATLLAGGFFVFGMYYGYQQGYEAAQESVSGQESSDQVTSRQNTDRNRPSSRQTRSGTETRRRAAITEEQLSGFGSDNNGETPVTEQSPRQSESQSENQTPSEARSTSSGGEPTQDDEPSEEERDQRPAALSVSQVDNQTDDSGEGAASEAETSETPESASTTGSEEASPEQNNTIEAEGPVFTIQAVSFLKESRAQREVEELDSRGYEAKITEKEIDGRRWYRVRVGNYSSRSVADEKAKEMIEQGIIEDYWISKVQK